MTYLTLTLATILLFIIPIAASTLARLIHFALGLQGRDFNINSIFGKVGLWFLTDSKYKAVNLFKDAVTCIYCFTTHIAALETIIAYTYLFGPFGLLALLIVPALALTLQNYLQFYIYQPYFEVSDEEEEEIIEDKQTNYERNGSN